MDNFSIKAMLSDIIKLPLDEINNFPPDGLLADIGLDSLKFLMMIVMIEQTYNIEVNDSDLIIENFATLNKIYETFSKYITGQHGYKKVLILDCDNVLWHGISGEEDISCNGDILKLHQAILDLYHHGVLICICSKNEPHNIASAFSTLDFPLKKEYIIIEKINRNDKVLNIKNIASELNVNIDSFVFVDDSDYEIGLVQSMLPEIVTVKVDYTDLTFIDEILGYFNLNLLSDLNRTEQYRQQKERTKEKLYFRSIDEYNQSLQTVITCEKANIENACRLSELSMRTNQFNISNARYSEEDIRKLLLLPEYNVLSLSVSDKYGDMGIVAMAIMHHVERQTIIEAFILSCRIFDRGIETVLLKSCLETAGDNEVFGIYEPTEKNQRCKQFFIDNGIKQL